VEIDEIPFPSLATLQRAAKEALERHFHRPALIAARAEMAARALEEHYDEIRRAFVEKIRNPRARRFDIVIIYTPCTVLVIRISPLGWIRRAFVVQNTFSRGYIAWADYIIRPKAGGDAHE